MIVALKTPDSIAGVAVQISQLAGGRIDGGWAALLSVLALVPPILGLLLVWYREPLAMRLFPEREGQSENRGLSAGEIQQSILLGLGIYFLVHGAAFFLSLGISTQWSQANMSYNPFVYGYLTEVLAGIWLILGSRGFIGAVVQFRNAGRSRADPENVSPPGAT